MLKSQISGRKRTAASGAKVWLFALSLVLFGSAAPVPSAAEDQQANSSFMEGNAVLDCTWTCSGSYGSSRMKLKELYVYEDWRALAALVIQIGHRSDQSYFYLGRAAEGLGANETALKYYRAALIQESGGGVRCNYLFNNCDGFDFPADINARIDAVKAVIAKANAPAPQIAEAQPAPAPAATAPRTAPPRAAPASNTKCGVVTSVPFALGFKANSAGKIQTNKIFKSGLVPVLLEDGTRIQAWATRTQAEQAAKDGGQSKVNLRLVKGKWRIVSFSAACSTPPTTAGAQLPFKDAINDGIASVTAEALNGGAQLNITFASLVDKSVTLIVPAGNSTIETTILNITFSSPNVQKIPLAPHASATITVDQAGLVLTQGSLTTKVIKSQPANTQPTPPTAPDESGVPDTAPRNKTPDQAQVLGDLGAVSERDIQAEIAARILGRQKLAEQLGALKQDEALIVFAIRTPEKGTAGRNQFSQVGLGEGGPVIRSGEMIAKLTNLDSEIPYLGTMRTKRGEFQQVYFVVMKATSQRIFGVSTLGSGTPRAGDMAMFNQGIGFIVIPTPKEVCFVKTFVFNYADKPTMAWQADPELSAWMPRRLGDVSPLVAAMKPCGQTN
jgi:hypothetical protein